MAVTKLLSAITLLCVAGTGAANAAADIQKQIAKCATMDGDLERLDCFDTVAMNAGLAGPQPQPVAVDGIGKWNVRRDINPVDDSERVIISLDADEGRSSGGEAITFVARCMSNKTEAYIEWNDYLGDDSRDVYEEWKGIVIRIGSSKSRTQQWGISTDSTGTFAPAWAGDLLKEMANADAFLAQVTPYNESPVTAIFDTRGMANALRPLAETCHWDQGQSETSTDARKNTSVPTADAGTLHDEFSGLLRSVEGMDSTD